MRITKFIKSLFSHDWQKFRVTWLKKGKCEQNFLPEDIFTSKFQDYGFTLCPQVKTANFVSNEVCLLRMKISYLFPAFEFLNAVENFIQSVMYEQYFSLQRCTKRKVGFCVSVVMKNVLLSAFFSYVHTAFASIIFFNNNYSYLAHIALVH